MLPTAVSRALLEGAPSSNSSSTNSSSGNNNSSSSNSVSSSATGACNDTRESRPRPLSGFHGVTRHLMPRLLSEAALQDKAIVADALAMAADIGRIGFVQQQTAIMRRRAQHDTLTSFAAPVLVLCGNLDVLTPPNLSVEMAGLTAQAELCLLNGIGHLSSIEAPEAVTNALESLFERAAD